MISLTAALRTVEYDVELVCYKLEFVICVRDIVVKRLQMRMTVDEFTDTRCVIETITKHLPSAIARSAISLGITDPNDMYFDDSSLNMLSTVRRHPS